MLFIEELSLQFSSVLLGAVGFVVDFTSFLEENVFWFKVLAILILILVFTGIVLTIFLLIKEEKIYKGLSLRDLFWLDKD